MRAADPLGHAWVDQSLPFLLYLLFSGVRNKDHFGCIRMASAILIGHETCTPYIVNFGCHVRSSLGGKHYLESWMWVSCCSTRPAHRQLQNMHNYGVAHTGLCSPNFENNHLHRQELYFRKMQQLQLINKTKWACGNSIANVDSVRSFRMGSQI